MLQRHGIHSKRRCSPLDGLSLSLLVGRLTCGGLCSEHRSVVCLGWLFLVVASAGAQLHALPGLWGQSDACKGEKASSPAENREVNETTLIQVHWVNVIKHRPETTSRQDSTVTLTRAGCRLIMKAARSLHSLSGQGLGGVDSAAYEYRNQVFHKWNNQLGWVTYTSNSTSCGCALMLVHGFCETAEWETSNP